MVLKIEYDITFKYNCIPSQKKSITMYFSKTKTKKYNCISALEWKGKGWSSSP